MSISGYTQNPNKQMTKPHLYIVSAIVVVLCLTSCVFALEKHYEPLEGLQMNPTFELSSGTNRVKDVCISRDNFGITTITTTYWGSSKTDCAGECPTNTNQIRACVTLSNDNNGRLKMYQTLAADKLEERNVQVLFRLQTVYELTGTVVIGSVYFRTVDRAMEMNIPFTTTQETNRFSSPRFVPHYRWLNNKKQNARSMYDSNGRVLMGFYGRTIGGYVVSLGFIFAATTSNEQPNVLYGPPVGGYRKISNYDFKFPSTADRVEEICCQQVSSGIRMIYVRTNTSHTIIGAGQNVEDPPLTKCLNVNGRPIIWESMANSHGASDPEFGGNGRLGYLKVTAGSQSIVCQGGSLVESSRYHSGSIPRFLVGMHGYGGWEVDWASPIWRNDPTSVALIAYKLDTEGSTISPLTPKAVVEQELINNSNVEQSMSVSGAYSTSVSTSLSSESTTAGASTKTLSAEASLSVTVSTDAIFASASVGVGFTFSGSTSWESSFEKTWSNSKSTSQTEEFTYEVPVLVPANSQVKASIVFTESVQDTPWTGFLQYTFPDGSNQVVQTSGVYKESKYRAISVSIE